MPPHDVDRGAAAELARQFCDQLAGARPLDGRD